MKYQAIHTGARDWVEESPLFDTREQAQAWLDKQLASRYRKDDEGFIRTITP